MKKNLIVFLAGMSALGMSWAGDGPHGHNKDHRPAKMIQKLDTNKDGKLSLDEFKAKAKERPRMTIEERFAKLDEDKDGFLTADELKKAKHKREPRKH